MSNCTIRDIEFSLILRSTLILCKPTKNLGMIFDVFVKSKTKKLPS